MSLKTAILSDMMWVLQPLNWTSETFQNMSVKNASCKEVTLKLETFYDISWAAAFYDVFVRTESVLSVWSVLDLQDSWICVWELQVSRMCRLALEAYMLCLSECQVKGACENSNLPGYVRVAIFLHCFKKHYFWICLWEMHVS